MIDLDRTVRPLLVVNNYSGPPNRHNYDLPAAADIMHYHSNEDDFFFGPAPLN